ncbi:MAG: hypothetical protein HeimC2_30070 [Candidatus Heimdallarchaeota archaeon LC_2]|nr:MAG: hypothetical protein HeimC2_30070 [Candidatus Heimdallarchaeota archaeon LC_2]
MSLEIWQQTMREQETQKSVDQLNISNLDLTIPEGGEKAPLILGITQSSIIQSTLTTYLIDLGFRVAGPFASIDSGIPFIKKISPDIIIFDVTSNKEELNLFIEILKKDEVEIPILLISNDEVYINYPFQSKLRLPINPHDLVDELQYLNQNKEKFTPLHHTLKFVNKLFSRLLELSPNNLRPHVETSINKVIFEFCSKNNEFSRISEESLAIIIKDTSFMQISDLIEILQETIQNLIENLNLKFESKIGSSLINDALEAIIISSPDIPTYIQDLIAKLGIDSGKFRHLVDVIIPKLEDFPKSCFVAFLSLGDLGPELVTYVATDDKISSGLNDGVAAQITTLVGQGNSYHTGIYGPIPIPTANNIVAMIWSKMLGSNIKDHRMAGTSLSVVVIGFYRELLTYLPSHDSMKSIYSLMDDITHVNEVNKDLLFEIQEKFLDSFM